MTVIDASYNINEKDLKEQQNINEKDLKEQQSINEKDLKQSDLKEQQSINEKDLKQSDLKEQQSINEKDLKQSDLKEQQNINEKDLKEQSIKPKRTLLQRVIKLHKFLCFQATTLLVSTLLLSSLCKCYDVLIYVSFGIFISMLFIGSYGLLLKFQVLASREFNEKYNTTIFNLWKKYVPFKETSFFTFMAVFTILWHITFALLALYYVKGFITDSINTSYSYIIGYLLILLFCVINYSSGFKLYNDSLNCSAQEYNGGFLLTLFIIGGLIYYFETIKSKYLNTNCLLYLL